MAKTSDSQQRILDLLIANDARDMPSPTHREIGKELGLGLSTVNYHLNALAERGLIESINGRTRAIVLAPHLRDRNHRTKLVSQQRGTIGNLEERIELMCLAMGEALLRLELADPTGAAETLRRALHRLESSRKPQSVPKSDNVNKSQPRQPMAETKKRAPASTKSYRGLDYEIIQEMIDSISWVAKRKVVFETEAAIDRLMGICGVDRHMALIAINLAVEAKMLERPSGPGSRSSYVRWGNPIDVKAYLDESIVIQRKRVLSPQRWYTPGREPVPGM